MPVTENAYMESIMSDLIPLFRPKSVALIGASSDTKKYGYWTAKSLIDNKFQGEIHLISRSGGEILGQPTYPDILSVPGEVDLAIIAIAPIITGTLVGYSSLAIGGTSVIILVGVALDTVKQMESQMMMRHYKGFLD